MYNTLKHLAANCQGIAVHTHEGVLAERLCALLLGQGVDRHAIAVERRLGPQLKQRKGL